MLIYLTVKASKEETVDRILLLLLTEETLDPRMEDKINLTALTTLTTMVDLVIRNWINLKTTEALQDSDKADLLITTVILRYNIKYLRRTRANSRTLRRSTCNDLKVYQIRIKVEELRHQERESRRMTLEMTAIICTRVAWETTD